MKHDSEPQSLSFEILSVSPVAMDVPPCSLLPKRHLIVTPDHDVLVDKRLPLHFFEGTMNSPCQRKTWNYLNRWSTKPAAGQTAVRVIGDLGILRSLHDHFLFHLQHCASGEEAEERRPSRLLRPRGRLRICDRRHSGAANGSPNNTLRAFTRKLLGFDSCALLAKRPGAWHTCASAGVAQYWSSGLPG